MASLPGWSAPDIVVVSPLHRTLQTSELAFPSCGGHLPSDMVIEKRTGRPCDERSEADALRGLFPRVNWREELTTLPQWATEGDEEVQRRAAAFLQWVRDCPHSTIAVRAGGGREGVVVGVW